MTLGELIKQLSNLNQEDFIAFDFCGLWPGFLTSYRGYYYHLALTWQNSNQTKVKDLLKILKAAIGKEFQGYKGGLFCMDESVSVYVDNPGDASGTLIVSVTDLGYGYVIINTACEEVEEQL